MKRSISKYLAEIGRRGGLKSKRLLSPAAAREMVRVREARRIYRRYHALCFWSYDKGYKITFKDIPWVKEQLMKNGDLEAWKVAERLCR